MFLAVISILHLINADIRDYDCILRYYFAKHTHEKERLIEIEQIYFHPDYDDVFNHNDVALIKLKVGGSTNTSCVSTLIVFSKLCCLYCQYH